MRGQIVRRARLVKGCQIHALWSNMTPALADEAMRRAKAAGVGNVRVDVGLASLQFDGRGTWNAYHLGRLDQLVDNATARGIPLLLTLAETPYWASGQTTTKVLPTNVQDYADALASLAFRYRAKDVAWEVWNEPNLEAFLIGPNKAERYAALVKAAYRAVKLVAPDVKVIAGAVSESDAGFVRALYAAGIKGSMDALSIHPYCHDKSPLDLRPDWDAQATFIRGVPAVRAEMVAAGDSVPLWLTEFGWSTNTVRDPAKPWLSGVPEATQALYTRQALDQCAQWPYVQRAYAYDWADQPVSATDLVGNYGLTRRDGTDKPVMAVFS